MGVLLGFATARGDAADLDAGHLQQVQIVDRADLAPRCEFMHVEGGCWSWSATNFFLEAGFVAVAVLDYLQTRTIIFEQPRYLEAGPFLPTRPTIRELNTVAILGTAAHVAIASAAPRPWRDLFQAVTFTVEAANVTRNFSIGLSLSF